MKSHKHKPYDLTSLINVSHLPLNPQPNSAVNLTINEVMSIVKFSRSTISRWIKQGKFPNSKPFGARSKRWNSLEIQAWINSQGKGI